MRKAAHKFKIEYKKFVFKYEVPRCEDLWLNKERFYDLRGGRRFVDF